MGEMKTLGILLAIVGVVALTLGVFGYPQQNAILDLGGVTATVTEHKTWPLGSIVGVAALLGGIALIVADKRRAT